MTNSPFMAILKAILPAKLREVLRAFDPQPLSTRQRLEAFPTGALPVRQPVTVRWNNHQIPFVDAQTDYDLSFTLGMIHYHLRGGQIAVFKRIFHGRLAEIAGPLGVNLDHALRILDYGYASDEIKRTLPPATRDWIQAFVDGMNAAQDRAKELPPEYALLGLKPEPFTFHDILTGSRFGGSDFSWFPLMGLLAQRGQPDFATLWNRTLEAGEIVIPGTHGLDPKSQLGDMLVGAGRSGSNSVAVQPRRSATGAAMLANDPHLGLSLPNLWIMVGARSPSFNLVGLMIPGLPVFAVGRNPELAWGGTNMRAASSDLFDVTDLDPSEITTTTTTIRDRLGITYERKIRRTRFGPIISDAKMMKERTGRAIALRWVGHDATDEFTAFLDAARARTPHDFHHAWSTYAVSGQNMTFADSAGNIGRVLAVRLPTRKGFPKDDPVLDATDPETHWHSFACATDLPFLLNPESGVLASANDRPEGSSVPIGFTFGSDDRVRRLYEILESRERLTIEDLSDLQTDTKATQAAILAADLVEELKALPGGINETNFLRRLSEWQGDYAVSSQGAVAFETFLYHLVSLLHGAEADRLPELLGQWGYLATYLLSDLRKLPEAYKQSLLRKAAAKAARDSLRFANWGDMHRLRLGHSLTRLPVVGSRFVVDDLPTGGSRQTPMKMAHGLVRKRHAATFGSMARHISDLSDVDANWFVLLGGQDGWLGSRNYADQFDLWRERRYIRMPLRPETIAKEFPIEQHLIPQDTAKTDTQADAKTGA